MKFVFHYWRKRNLKKVIKSDRLRADLPFRRQRSLWITTSILVTVIATVGIVTATFQFGLPWWMQEGDHNHHTKAMSVLCVIRFTCRLSTMARPNCR